jgi:hypothetical protein
MATYKNIFGDYVITTQSGDDEIVLTSANIRINGPLSVNGNISTTQFYFGDGQFLSNVVANVGAATKLQNGTSNVDIPVTNGNITFGVTGIGNVIVVSPSQQTIGVSTPAVDQYTGALVVAGGVGVGGSLFSGAVYNNSQPVLNAISVINGGTY